MKSMPWGGGPHTRNRWHTPPPTPWPVEKVSRHFSGNALCFGTCQGTLFQRRCLFREPALRGLRLVGPGLGKLAIGRPSRRSSRAPSAPGPSGRHPLPTLAAHSAGAAAAKAWSLRGQGRSRQPSGASCSGRPGLRGRGACDRLLVCCAGKRGDSSEGTRYDPRVPNYRSSSSPFPSRETLCLEGDGRPGTELCEGPGPGRRRRNSPDPGSGRR